jgi:hypothetical protein
MGKLIEAKTLFDRAYTILETILGPRHPRTTTVHSNVEKSKRWMGVKLDRIAIKENISLRPDADRLFQGTKYVIAALPPGCSGGATTKKKSSKGTGKKKKK